MSYRPSLVGLLGLAAFLLSCGAVGSSALAEVRPHAGMLRYPDVSATHIVFVYANDLWLVPREGGLATPLASPAGIERLPRFSNDGQTIAFMGNYDGNTDLYTISVDGGVPTRVTYHPDAETLCGWSPAGRLIFQATGRGDFRFLQLFTVAPEGGMPERLPVPYGGNGTISDDSAWLAYTPSVREGRTWKRYRGGNASDVWLFNLNDHSSRQLTDWEGTDSLPMWHGEKLYFVSDAGPHHKLNIWAYDLRTSQRRQVTTFTELDVKSPAIGPGPAGRGEIVFQNGPDLYLLDLQTEKARSVNVVIPGDRPTIRPQRVDASEFLRGSDISATGKRAVFEARGDIWTVPAKEGVPRNLTRTSGVAERRPAWSPDGRWIAYFSDADGEYDLYITQSDGKGETRKLAALGEGYRYGSVWSPDSERIAFIDSAGATYLCEMETGKVTQADVDPAGRPPHVSWAHDSRWIAYTRTGENNQSAIWIYEVESGARHQVTSGMFSDTWPTFDRKGDYLFFASQRSFTSPIYEDVGASFVYTDTDQLFAVPLRDNMDYAWAPKNDEETWKEEEEKAAETQPAEDADDAEEAQDAKDQEGADADDDENNGKEDKAAADDGVSGVWEGTIKGSEELPPEGLPLTITLRVSADGSVSGSMNAGPYAGTITSGTYNRASGELNLTLDVTTEEGVETFAVVATVSDGSISGTVTGGEFGATFEATRTSTEVPAAEGEDDEAEDGEREVVEISFDGFEQRALRLPARRGNYYNLLVNDKNQLLYARPGRRGSGTPTEIMLFDMEDEKKEEKKVVSGANSFDITADGKKLLVRAGGKYSIVDAKPGQKLGKKVPLDGMTAIIQPREEWEQLFNEAWRIERDFFYVENMHGVDWPAMRKLYGGMLADCISRDDVAYILRELIAELNIGHAYYYGGSSDVGPRVSVGLLGVDFALENGAYRIARIHAGGPWDVDARGPLSQPGVDVKEGDYLLEVNGIALDTSKEPWAAFQGLAGQIATLTVSEKPEKDDDAREVLVKLLNGEEGLRYRSWVEANRKYVDKQTDGRVGYIYVPDTGRNGQNNLFRQFYGQRDEQALIIDERWNRGGQIPTRFIELLNRPLLNYWASRHGRDGRTPPDAHFGPKCMLINGAAGSGGDMFPALFRQTKLGKLIGRRTWGGLVGISGNPGLIDGTSVTVPTFGYYEIDGTWGIEGHGVDPDIEVIDDPALMVDGGDPQLDAAIKHMLAELERDPFVPTNRPRDPDRSGMGIRAEDK